MSENTMRVIQAVSREVDFDQEYFGKDAVSRFEKMAAERSMTVDLGTLKYIGEVNAPESVSDSEAVKANKLGFHAFEAEAV